MKKTSMNKITDKEWREALADGAKAKELLINMQVPSNGELCGVSFVQLSNGNQIPVKDVTEKQAHDFISMIAPSRCCQGIKQ